MMEEKNVISLYLSRIIDNFVKFIFTKIIRAFFSLNIEDDSVRKRVAKIQENLKTELQEYDIKWEDPSKFHLTLRFLGNIDEGTVNSLAEESDRLEFGFDKIILESRGIGCFPNKKFPNVIFLDLADKEDNSIQLAEKVEDVVKKFGFRQEKRFVPHVTLGRFRKGMRKRMGSMPEIEVGEFKIVFNSFFLMKSVMDSRGSKYFPVRKFYFQRPAKRGIDADAEARR